MLDQTRQGCKFVSRELMLLYCVSSVHVHPHATTHARLSGCSTPVMSRRTSSLSALSRHILDWDKCQLWMGRVWTQQRCIPSKAVMQHCRASSELRQQQNRLLGCRNIHLYSLYMYSGLINIPYLCLLSCVLKETSSLHHGASRATSVTNSANTTLLSEIKNGLTTNKYDACQISACQQRM